MSFTATLFPIIAALVSIEKGDLFKEMLLKWKANNQEQKYFIENIYSKEAKKKFSLFNSNELKCLTSGNYQQLNKFAKDNGFDIKFNPFHANEYGMASILNIVLKWKEKGTDTILISEENPQAKNKIKYKATRLKNNFQVIQTNYIHPIIKINTQANDTVYLTVADNPVDKYEDLINKINMLKAFLKQKHISVYFDNLIFPFVELNNKVDISWLANLQLVDRFNGDSIWAFIRQALQQTKFKMNSEGASVESCVLISYVTKGMSPMINDYTIDKPFYIWIERKGVSLPIFAGYITQENWVKA